MILDRRRIALSFSRPIPTGHGSECRCQSCKDFLGTCLEWVVGQSLEQLKELGLYVKDVQKEAFPDQLAKEKRYDGYPDWWALLYGGAEVELECKNWTARPKDLARVKPGQTTFWAYRYDTVKSTLGKRWLPNSKRVLVITTMELLTKGHRSGQSAVAEERFDDVFEIWKVAINPDDEELTNKTAKGLVGIFEKFGKG